MLKKILAVVLAVMMLGIFATSCKKKEEDGSSSKKQPTSSVENIVESGDEESSSAIADIESDEPSSDMQETNSYKWTIETKSAFFRDTDEAKESVTKSETIKQYTNSGTYQLAGYQVHMQWLTAYGTDTQSRAKEFEDIVKSGYFNTYLLGADDEYLHYELPLVAEAGATFWLSTSFYDHTKTSIEDYTKRIQYYVDLVDSYGCLDLLNGFYWDEPILRGMTNEDLYQATKVHYVKFGLRSFPVFACGSFSEEEGNADAVGKDPSEWGKLSKYGATYLTDISYDSYGTDVRPGASYTQERIDRWEEITGHVYECDNDGMDYYRAYKEWLFECVGHPANFYYYPCAQEYGPIQGGLVQIANEDYCLGHLEYMAEDVLNDERGGGLVLYNFPTQAESSIRNLDMFIVLNDENGFPLMWPDVPKWEKYSAALLKVREKFDATKQIIQFPVK